MNPSGLKGNTKSLLLEEKAYRLYLEIYLFILDLSTSDNNSYVMFVKYRNFAYFSLYYTKTRIYAVLAIFQIYE